MKGKNTVEFKNVAVGEVWVCSGQSNMEWSVNAGEDPAKVKEGAKNPNLRLFTVQKRATAHPITDQGDLKHFGKWAESSPDTVGGFSAVAYHFGQKLQKELGVPVGLIHTSWGGTPAQAWASLEALDANPMLKYYANSARAAAKAYDEYDQKKALENYEKALVKWKEDAEKLKAAGKPVPKEPSKPGATAPAPGPGTPAVLYNAMIYPLLSFKVKGAIWYQGESNNGKAYEYRTLFPTMIKDWRKRFDCDLPFMLVQLAPFGNGQRRGGRLRRTSRRSTLRGQDAAEDRHRGHHRRGQRERHPPEAQRPGWRTAGAGGAGHRVRQEDRVLRPDAQGREVR